MKTYFTGLRKIYSLIDLTYISASNEKLTYWSWCWNKHSYHSAQNSYSNVGFVW